MSKQQNKGKQPAKNSNDVMQIDEHDFVHPESSSSSSHVYDQSANGIKRKRANSESTATSSKAVLVTLPELKSRNINDYVWLRHSDIRLQEVQTVLGETIKKEGTNLAKWSMSIDKFQKQIETLTSFINNESQAPPHILKAVKVKGITPDSDCIKQISIQLATSQRTNLHIKKAELIQKAKDTPLRLHNLITTSADSNLWNTGDNKAIIPSLSYIRVALENEFLKVKTKFLITQNEHLEKKKIKKAAFDKKKADDQVAVQLTKGDYNKLLANKKKNPPRLQKNPSKIKKATGLTKKDKGKNKATPNTNKKTGSKKGPGIKKDRQGKGKGKDLNRNTKRN
jgi:hypothetical protein